MEQDYFHYLVKKFIAGDISPEEKEALEIHWKKSLKNESFQMDFSKEEIQKLQEEIFTNIRSKIEIGSIGSKLEPYKASVKTKSIFAKSHWYRIAAVITLFLVVTILLLQVSNQDSITLSTSFGETKTFTLPDGSLVTLNGNSTLKYSDKFFNKSDASAQREVWLTGEGFFSVIHTKSNSKFIVHSGDLMWVEVLGTEFNVINRKKSKKVILKTGKVRLNLGNETGSKAITMDPGDLVEVESNSKYHIKKVDPLLFTSWRDNKLYFQDSKVAEIIQMLRETYGKEIIVKDKSILNEQVTGSVPSDNLDNLLFALSETFGLKILHNENEIIISEMTGK